MSYYGYMADYLLSPCDHLAERVEPNPRPWQTSRKCNPALEFRLGICTNLKDNIVVGHESIVGESLVATLLYDMIDKDPKYMSRYHIDFRQFHHCRRNARFTYWLCDCLNRFDKIMKKAGIYEMTWYSHSKQQIQDELLKTLWLAGRLAGILFLHATVNWASLHGMFIGSLRCP